MTRQQRKQLHRKGEWPKATPAVFIRRRLGDPPGFYGARESSTYDRIKPAEFRHD